MFNEQFKISIRDIDYGVHLSHIAILGYLWETRVRYLESIGCSENNVDGLGSVLVVVNLTCDYKQESFYGDIINVQIESYKESELKLLFKYVVSKDNKIIATAKITTVFIDKNHKLIRIPKNLLFTHSSNQMTKK